jgi:hypothetical protein
MGFLGWQGWDRLDELDRRTGLRREPSQVTSQRSQRFMWAISVMVFLSAVSSAIQGDWQWAVALGVLVPLSIVMNRRAIRKVRDRAG